MITYSEVILNRFVFDTIKLDSSFEKLIWNLSYEDFGTHDGEVRFRLRDVDDQLRNEIGKVFMSATTDEHLINSIKSFHYDINQMRIGEWVPMHNETGQLSPFEVILWLTKTDDYKGREFVMRDQNGVETSVQPHNGMVCFLDTTQKDVYHGVNKLISDTEIISITGGLGRKRESYARAD